MYIDPTGYSWWSALWSFIAGLVGAVVAVVVTAVAGPIIGGMAGGAVSGAIMGAVQGGISGALKGAMWGAAFGGILGAGYQAASVVNLGGAFLAAAAVGGAAYAGVTGGAEGLGDYAAGALGAVYGSAMGNALISGSNTSNQGPAGDSQGSIESKPAVREAVGGGDLEEIKVTVEETTGKPSGLSGNDTADVIRKGIQSGELGRGNNPKAPLVGKSGPLPSQAELFWRGSMDSATEIGGNTITAGNIIQKIGKALTMLLPRKFKHIGRAITKGGEIDVQFGKKLQAVGRWGKSQFPEPYW